MALLPPEPARGQICPRPDSERRQHGRQPTLRHPVWDLVVLRPAPLRPEPVREFEQAVDHRGAREAIDPRPEVEEIPDVFEEADAEVFVLANTELDGGREAVKGFGELMCFDCAAWCERFRWKATMWKLGRRAVRAVWRQETPISPALRGFVVQARRKPEAMRYRAPDGP